MKLHTSISALAVIVTITLAPAEAQAQCTCPPAEPPVVTAPQVPPAPTYYRVYMPYLGVQR
jgi:hypothetical protein